MTKIQKIQKFERLFRQDFRKYATLSQDGMPFVDFYKFYSFLVKCGKNKEESVLDFVDRVFGDEAKFLIITMI